MNLAHSHMNIRYSDNPQASKYPILDEALYRRLRHNSDMAFTFDIALVREEMKKQGITQTQLASAAGLTSQSAVANILAGDRQVKVDEAAKIYSLLKLVPGGAEPIKTVAIIGLSNAGAWRESIRNPIGSMSIPYAVGGQNAFAIEVKGDSMNLLIDDGGYVVVDPAQRELYDSRVYLIENEEYETTVKRYRSNPARFVPVSNNPEHKEFPVGDVYHRVIGRVVWKGGMVE